MLGDASVVSSCSFFSGPVYRLNAWRCHVFVAAYVSFVVAEVDAQNGHGTDDGDQRLDRVAVDDRLELLVVFAREPAFVYDSAHDGHHTSHLHVNNRHTYRVGQKSGATDS